MKAAAAIDELKRLASSKRDEILLIAFLDKHGSCIPRTAIRYAIEHFPLEVRNEYLRSTRS